MVRVPEGKGKVWELEQYLIKLVEKFPNMVKSINLNIHETSRILAI